VICPNCQEPNREGARFCKKCRTSFVPEDTPTLAVSSKVSPVVTAESSPAALPIVPASTGVPSEPEAELNVSAANAESPIDSPEPIAAEQRLEAAQELSGVEEAAPAPVSQPITAQALPVTLAKRYTLTEIIQQSSEAIAYRAFDSQTCAQCHTPRADLSDFFCSQCGAEIGDGAVCRVQTGNIPDDVPPASSVVDNEVSYWIAFEPIAESAPPAVAQNLRLHAGYVTHPGQVRAIDEDSLLVVTGMSVTEGTAHPSLGVFAVADGMGGHDNGQEASRRVVHVLAEKLLPGLLAPTLSGQQVLEETFETAVCDAVQEANRRLTSEARAAGSDMGSTLTLAFVRDGHAIVTNVGDSRTYLWQGGILRQITTDHSIVARLVEKGMLQPEDIYEHPRRSEIYRVMGDKPEVEIDIFHCDLQAGDRLVLCCDGVWEMIHTEGIEDVLLAYPDNPQAACDEIMRRANLAGGEDNISVIVVDVRGG
jgi:serine/threonine protein phosphatase PrpC